MRQRIVTALLALSLSPLLVAGPSPIYENAGTITSTPTVDAVIFQNSGIFNVSTLLTFTNIVSAANILATPFPFATRDTLYFTNTGTMSGIPGFQLDTSTATKRFSTLDVYNSGTLIGQDVAAIADFFGAAGATTFEKLPQYSQPIPSQVLIFSTNVVNSGEIGVGNAGLLKIVSKTFTNAYGALAAGGVNTGGSSSLILSEDGIESVVDPLDDTGRGEQDGLNGFYVNPPYVYDLIWGATNGGQLRVDQLAAELPLTPPLTLGGRGLLGLVTFAAQGVGTSQAGYATYVDTFTVGSPTNVYWEIVFVNTNFADTNITANVEFSQDIFNSPPQPDAGDPVPPATVIQYAVTTTDVLTGNLVTNAIYLIDTGAVMTNIVLMTNASAANNYNRPMNLEITTSTPEEWEFGTPALPSPFDPSVIYAPGSFVNFSVPFIAGEYGAQIGRDPETLSGDFVTTFNENLGGTNISVFEDELLLGGGVALPDPTNEAGRIDITAGQADLTAARIRAEGIVMLNITNLIGAGTGASDWGMTDAKIGMTNGSLVLANFFPTNFQRVRGGLNAWSGTWQNIFTNAVTTNSYHMHVLVVDQTLRGNFRPSIRNLTLTGSKVVDVQNDLTVINQAIFDTSNLVLNANVTLTQGAGNLNPANVPRLQNLLINPGASLVVDSVLDIGYNLTQVQGSPVNRKYAVSSIANYGTIEATAPLFQSQAFVNDGVIFAVNQGSMAINASQISLGSIGAGQTNYLVAEGNITLSAQSIEATNSAIIAGLTQAGSLTLDVTGNLTDDFTNADSVTPMLVNQWQVSDGFNLPVKPATGDLFGTEITTIAAANTLANHVWSGVDMGPTVAGFHNNAVIGHLVLDRTAASGTLRFTGAGSHNAMYVDYLELTNSSYLDYRHGLIIDPNIKIYFADANADPIKLMEVYPNGLVWVTNFFGPNSTVLVSNLVNSSVCPMNAALYNSEEIGFFGIPNAFNQPYVLNDPSDPNIFQSCPLEGSTMAIFAQSLATVLPGTRPQSLVISANGSGTVGPNLTQGQLAMGTANKLTATPAKGWSFAGWTVSGLASGLETNLPVLEFTVTHNAIITANFIPIPFASLKGVYDGLFYEPGSVTANSGGFFTLTLTASGSFSGKLTMGASTYTFASLFYGSGYQQVQAKCGKLAVTVTLQLDISGKSGTIHGDVNGGAWDTPILANLTPSWTAKNPTPVAGRYTMALTGAAGVGDSFGVVTVSTLGVVSVTGTLADGVNFSQTTPVSKSGQWPFYAYAASGRDSVLGWVNFAGGTLASANVTWIKAPGLGHYYPAGFDDSVQLIGSPYAAPHAKLPALNLLDASVTLNGGNLPSEINSSVTLQRNLSYAAGSTTISFTASTGAFSGKFGANEAMHGVILQNQNSARGFFLGTNQSGAVLLQGN